MADSPNDIDQIFNDRFNGAKDFSIDPSSAWSAVESGLTSASASTATGAATAGKLSILKIAASILTLTTVAGISTGDREFDPTTASTNIILESGSSFIQNSTPSIENSNLESIPMAAAIADDQKKSDNPNSSSVVTLTSLIEAETQADELTNAVSVFENSTKPNRTRDAIAFMDELESAYNTPDIFDKDLNEEPSMNLWRNKHGFYLRAAMRFGSGESNSYEVPSQWKATPTFALGYSYTLSDVSFISAEVGLLRRTGNGIERSRSLNLDPIISSLAENFGQSFEGNKLVVHESLVATRMDYVHIPVSYNRTFNNKWTATVGGFMDYLISAKNEAYIVYDNTQYRQSVIGKSELNSKSGLNKIRYGALLGVERTLYRNVSAFGHFMVPLNSAVDANSEFSVIDQTNKLVDIQLGLVFRI